MPTALTPRTTDPTGGPAASLSGWQGIIARYQGGDVRRSLFQLLTTFALLVGAFVAMYRMLDVAPWVTALLALPAAGFMIRTFIIMHDCVHGSFLPWPRVNDAVGIVTGLVLLTPYAQWRRDHALHHASSGDLDRRGHGDVQTLTVREFLARSWWGRLQYRLLRHPAILLGLGPLHMIVLQRFRGISLATGRRQLASVWITNIGIAAAVTAFVLATSAKAVLLVYLPTYYLATIVGVWLFYVQHQFEDAYWERRTDWDYATAAMNGSSHLRLPRVLRWFTGNIGLHHVHHLGPRIPNYRLQRAHDENALFQHAPEITIMQGIRSLRLSLWDEERRRLVRFSDAGLRRL